MNFKNINKNTSINLTPYETIKEPLNKFNIKKLDDYEEIDYSIYPLETPTPNLFFDSSIPCKSQSELKNYIESCNEKYFNTDKFENQKEFRNYLCKDKFVSKPNRDTSYATQGCCAIGTNTLITSYDTGYHKESKGKQQKVERSILNIVDDQGREKKLYFDNTGHVGGISYYNQENKIYVSGEYDITENGKSKTIKTIDIYDVSKVATLKNGETLKPSKQYTLDEEKDKISTASYLTVHNDNLYAGVFDKDGPGKITRYKLDENGNPQYEETLVPPIDKVQGMCVYEHNGEEYFFFSSSHGRTNNSSLYVGKLNENGTFEEVTTITMPCMAEQVSIDADGNLMIVFESDCTKYADAADGNLTKSDVQVGNVCFLDTEKIINDNTPLSIVDSLFQDIDAMNAIFR